MKFSLVAFSLIAAGATLPTWNKDSDIQRRDVHNSIWSGAVRSAPAGAQFDGIYGEVLVPRANAPAGAAPGVYEGGGWVGIDGVRNSNAILQAGVTWTVDTTSGTRVQKNTAWVEWFPRRSVEVPELGNILAGQTIAIQIVSGDPSRGTVALKNMATGKLVTKKLTAPNTQSYLKGLNAEWIIEDFIRDNNPVPFADYGSTTISNVHCGTKQGDRFTAMGAAQWDMTRPDGSVRSDATIIDAGNTISFEYTA